MTASMKLSLNNLPSDPLLLMLSFLDFRDLIRSDKIQKVQTWKELFREFYTDLGHYADHYGTLKKAWDDLKGYLDLRRPRLVASLKGSSFTKWFTLYVHNVVTGE